MISGNGRDHHKCARLKPFFFLFVQQLPGIGKHFLKMLVKKKKNHSKLLHVLAQGWLKTSIFYKDWHISRQAAFSDLTTPVIQLTPMPLVIVDVRLRNRPTNRFSNQRKNDGL